MVNTIFIVNEAFKTQQVLTIQGERTFFDDVYTLDLATCTETFEFSTNATDIEETNYVLFYYHKEYRLFQITEIEQEHSEGKIITHVYAECACLELLNNAVRPFQGEFNCISFFNYILTGTRWTIGQYSSSLAEKVINVNVKNTTQIWTLMQEYMAEFGYEFSPRVTYGNGHVKRFYIDIFSEGNLGNKTYKRFEYGRNVSGIIKKKDLYEFCTALILDTDKDVVNVEYNKNGYIKEKGSDVVIAKNENDTYNFGRDYIYANFEDNESSSGEEVVTKAVEELKRRAVPRFDYEVTTAMTFEEYDDINLGDTVYVIDHTFNPIITLEARIGELEISFTDRNNCKCNLTNYKEIKSKISVELTGGIQDIIDSYFPITSDKLAPGSVDKDKINVETYNEIIADAIGASKIVTEELIAKEIIAINAQFENIEAEHGEFKDLTTENFEAINAKIDNLEVGDLKAINAEIDNLKAKDAEIENLVATKANITDLNATNADIENLKATKADIIDLNATNADIDVLNAEFADIKTLVNGNLTSDNILAFEITADKVTMDDAFIKDAHIANINASKINAGTINTANVSITSEDGGISIADETMQFKDENDVVRIQMGRDSNNNFTFALYDETGRGQLINADGIQSSDAIADGLIRNGHVSDDANISGSKLDISSVITEVNNDTSTTIKSNKIYLNEQNQSLEVAFNSLKTQVETIQDVTISGDLSSIVEQVQSNTTEINVCKEGISTLVAENTTLKETVTDLDGDIVEVNNTLTSKYASLEQSLNGFKTSVADTYATKSTVNDLENNLTTNYSTTSAMNSAINQSKSEITTTVSNTYATKSSVNDLENNLATNYSTTTDMNSAIEQKANSILSTVSSTYVSSEELDALNIGTRNLLKGTDKSKTLIGNSTENQTITLFNISDPSLLAGKTATLSFKYKLSDWNGQGGIKAQTGYDQYDQFKQVWFTSNGTYTYTSTITFSSTNQDTVLQIRADWLGGTVEILPKTAILVISDKKADWSQAPEDIIDNISSVEQKADKISWLVKSGTSESNMVLTDSMYSLITENITLSADKIMLEGYVSANNNFTIDLAGNMTAHNGTFSGNITGSTFSSTDAGFQVNDAGEVRGTDISTSGTLTGWDIVASGTLTAPWYAPCLTRNVTVYIQSDYIYPTLDGSSEINFYHNAYFRSFSDLLSVCPRNLNGYTLRVRFESNLSELVEINGLNNGNLYIEMYGYTLNGYFSIQGHSLWAGIYGNRSGSTNTSTRGVIKPNTGYLYSNYRYAILAQTNKFYLYDVDIYKGKATDYPSNCISVSSGCSGYINSVKAVNTPNCLLRCHASAHVYVASSSGITSSTVFQAVSGSIIVVNDTTQAGRPSSANNQYFEDNNSKVFADNVTWDSVAQTGTNDNNDTSTTITKTVTIKSDNGYSWRTNGSYANSWSTDAIVRQGRWTTGYGMNVGYWFFDDDIYDILQDSDNTVTAIKIKITRASGGNSASRTHYLRCHTYAKKSSSSSPSLLGTNVLNKSFSLAVGNSTTISLTSSEISALKSNEARGFGLYTSDSTTGANGSYSCCSASATVTITYKTTA